MLGQSKIKLKRKANIPHFKANEGSELEPFNFQELIKNAAKKTLAFQATQANGSPLPTGIFCTQDGLFAGKAAVGTAKPTPYSLFITVSCGTEKPLTFSATLTIYVRTKDTDIAEYNKEKTRKFNVQEEVRRTLLHIAPTAYPAEPILSDTMTPSMEGGMGYGLGGGGGAGPAHPILGKAAQFSGDFPSENSNPSDNNRQDIQNRLRLINSLDQRPAFNPQLTATR